MASILDDVFNSKTTVDNLIEWLVVDNSKLCEDFCSQKKSDFVPYFLNYLKDNCNWLLSNNETDKDNREINKQSIKLNDQSKSSLILKSSRKSPVPCTDNSCENGKQLNSSKNLDFNLKCVIAEGTPNVGHKKRNFQRFEFNSTKDSQTFNSVGIPYSKSRSDVKTMKPIPNTQNSPFINKNQAKFPNIESLEIFPPIGVTKTNTKSSRRITPTPVESVNSNQRQFSNSFFCAPEKRIANDVFSSSPFQEKSNDLQQEREMIRRTRETFFEVPQNAIEPKVQILKNKTSENVSIQPIVPDSSLVFSIDKLQMCVKIYNCFINNGFAPNITAELHFIFRLLTTRLLPQHDSQSNSNSIFHSVHNCTYFAVSVLDNQHDLLSVLDKSTLMTLVEIPYLANFSTELVSFLKECCTISKDEKKTKLSILNCVPYQVDDDNRNNFPDDSSFHNFKKQRDLFYELLREWQQQHLSAANFNFEGQFIRKVRQLINLGSNNVNLYHLARLIQSQLIASCLCFEVDEVYDELLCDIRHNFPDKFDKLQERFSTPSNVGIFSRPQSFYGIQLFFCELIETASSAVLNQYLMDLLVDKILQLNDANICDEIYSVLQIKEKFTSILHTLRLLAKFLGYVQFLPYKISGQLPSKLVKDQVNIRENVISPFNVMDLLHKSISKNHLVLTVPWTVEYLSMMDEVSRNLKKNQQVLNILADIYRGKFSIIFEKKSFLFLRFVIGWLFDIQYFPFKFDILVQPFALEKQPSVKIRCLDCIPVVDKQLIYSCCPYLIEFKILIDDFLNGIRSKNREIRKITPVSTFSKNLPSSNHQIESNLEENFYFLHPPSVKKTVEFVAERIASKVIHKIRINVTNMKLSIVKNISSDDSFSSILLSNITMQRKCKKIVAIVDSNTLDLKKEIINEADCLCKDVGLKEIKNILPVLLPEETKLQVLETCIKICFRLAIEKINEWCEANLLINDIKSDICNKLQHSFKKEASNENNNILSCKDVSAKSIALLRHAVVEMRINGNSISATELIRTCADISLIVNEKCTVNADRILVLSLTIDLCIAVLICSPQVWSNELCDSFIFIWQHFPESYNFSKRFLSSQTLYLLQNSRCSDVSILLYAELLVSLLRNNICNIQSITECINCKSKTSPEYELIPIIKDGMEQICLQKNIGKELIAQLIFPAVESDEKTKV